MQAARRLPPFTARNTSRQSPLGPGMPCCTLSDTPPLRHHSSVPRRRPRWVALADLIRPRATPRRPRAIADALARLLVAYVFTGLAYDRRDA